MTNNWQDVVARLRREMIGPIVFDAAALIEKHAAEIERLREALTVIEGGHYDRAGTWVLAGRWPKLVNAMQETARAALAAKPGDGHE